jgi:hypothetical protein
MPAESPPADPVVAEIRAVRRRLLEESGGDVAEFRRRLREHQTASGRIVISGPLKKATEPREAMDSRSPAGDTAGRTGAPG